MSLFGSKATRPIQNEKDPLFQNCPRSRPFENRTMYSLRESGLQVLPLTISSKLTSIKLNTSASSWKPSRDFNLLDFEGLLVNELRFPLMKAHELGMAS